MKIETTQTLSMPDDHVFVDHFSVYIAEDGLHVKAKSKDFAGFVERLCQLRPTEGDNEYFGQGVWKFEKGQDMYFLGSNDQVDPKLSSLSFLNHYLVRPDMPIGANMGFLAFPGLAEGIDVVATLPYSVTDALDFYHAALQGFQLLYSDYLRPVQVSAIMKEIRNGD